MKPRIESIQEQASLFVALLIKYQEISDKNFLSIKINLEKIFYQLKQKYPRYFNRLMFDTNGHVPISDYINNIIVTLEIGQNLFWDYHDKLFIDTRNCDLKKELAKIPWVTLPQIEKITKKLCRLIEKEENLISGRIK